VRGGIETIVESPSHEEIAVRIDGSAGVDAALPGLGEERRARGPERQDEHGHNRSDPTTGPHAVATDGRIDHLRARCIRHVRPYRASPDRVELPRVAPLTLVIYYRAPPRASGILAKASNAPGVIRTRDPRIRNVEHQRAIRAVASATRSPRPGASSRWWRARRRSP
jgi:hypothetical protein